MDPNQDGFVSIDPTGFSDRGFDAYYVKEFEIPMFGIPIVGSGEALADNQVGAKCGITDITVDSLGFGAYAILDDADNLIFRFRIGTDNPSVEAYTILIDTDGKIGPNDPNATPNNPGFEIDITLIKNNSQGIVLFNIDGIESCPTPIKTYGFNSNFQIAVADIITCSGLDYFYDFFIPFSDLESLLGISRGTELRFVALTNVSATCAMAGKISDIGGVDDTEYDGCISCAFEDLINNQCPIVVDELCGDCAGFKSGVTPKPVIDLPVKAGENIISGTAVPGATVFIDLYDSENVLKESISTIASNTSCTECPWVATFANTLLPGNIIFARAKSSTGCQSGGISSDATITIVVSNIPPVISGTGSTLSYTENDPAIPVDVLISLSDSDDIDLDEATVSIISNFSVGEDVLSFTPVSGISGSFNPSAGSITFTGSAPLTSYRTLLASIAYNNTSEDPATLTRTVRFQVNDGLDFSNVYERQINVISVNDAPVANHDNGAGNEDSQVSIMVSSNDTDADGTIDASSVDLEPLTAGKQISVSNTQGNWSVDASGLVTFTPALNFNGPATKTYTVNDNLGAVSSPATITITINSVNDPPVANNDNGTTQEDTPVTLSNIAANDTDVDGAVDVSTIDLDPSIAGQQTSFNNAQGDWNVQASGTVTYTPAANFNGDATKTYVVNDNLGASSNVATLTIIVNGVNDEPVAIDDSGITDEDTPLILPDITANDSDIDGAVDAGTVDLDPLTIGKQTAFSNGQGSWSVAVNGAVTYTPQINFNGVASKAYTANDNSGATSNPAFITVTVNSVNDAPVANNDFGTTDEDTPVTVANITANDSDVDGTIDAGSVDLDPLTAGQQITFTNSQGVWSVNGSGEIDFVPAANYNGPAAATYVVNDNSGSTSNQATLAITVNSINDTPVANDDIGSTDEDVPVVIANITANDTDVDGTISSSTVDLDLLTAGKQISISNAQGIWEVDASGSVTYTPALNFNGIAVKSYTVDDNSGSTSNAAMLTINVNDVNDSPTSNDDSGTTDKDTGTTLFGITSNDTDIDGTVDASTVDLDPSTGGKQTIFANVEGNWTVDASGNVTFTPASGFTGITTIYYTVNDNSGATSNSAAISITVTNTIPPGGIAPVAADDNGNTDEDIPLTIDDITANDTDADGTIDATSVDLDPLTIGQQMNITNAQGSWSVNTSGSVTYTPTLNFNGPAFIIYTVLDNVGTRSNQAIINITVNSVNDAPVANDDSGNGNEDAVVLLEDITMNDTDVDGVVDAATIDLDPDTPGYQSAFTNTAGIWSATSGTISYAPALDFNGTAVKSYTVSDNLGKISNEAILSINVAAVNDAPVANNDNGNTNEDTPVTLPGITNNDTDVDGTIDPTTTDIDLLTGGIQNIFINTQGEWSLNSGDLMFTPSLNFQGTAILNYTVADDLGSTSNIATVSVIVNAVNDAPVAMNDSGTTPEDTAIILPDITGNDTDADGTINIGSVDLEPSTPGLQSILATNEGNWEVSNSGDLTFTPKPDFNGTAQANYNVLDNLGSSSNSALITIIVTSVNDAPVAGDDAGTTSEDASVSISITANDTDADGTVDAATVDLDPFTNDIQNSFSTAQGTWSANVSGDILFSPVSDFNGVATRSYTVNDNDGATSNIGVITITVTAVNDAPLATDDEGATMEDISYIFPNITANDIDVDGIINTNTVDLDPLTSGIQATYMDEKGSWSVNTSGDVTFTPVPNFNGIASAKYTVKDNEDALSNTSVIAISVGAVNDKPVLKDLTVSTGRNIAVSGNVIDLSDTDPDGTPLSLNTTPVNDADNGTIIIQSDGVYTYTPGFNFIGTDVVTVQMCDEGLPLPKACADKIITFNVHQINRAPVILINGVPEDSLSTTTTEDTPVVFCFEVIDPDGDDITLNSFTHVSGGGMLITYTNTQFCLEYTPVPDFNGVSVWEIEICDNGSPGLCSKLTATIIVTPLNDSPQAVADTMYVLRNKPAAYNVLDNDFDVDNDALTVTTTPVIDVLHGEAKLDADGRLTYVSALTFTGIDSLVYEICDGTSACGQAKVIIIVEDVPLKVYQGITPNGDGNNDYLQIDQIDFYTNNEILIFDQYNNLVFQISGYNNADRAWRGEANKGLGSRELPEGTYFYTINLGDNSPLLKGFVVLKRN